jgi:hypothetical protein
MDRYRRRQSHIHNLLGPIEISRCDGRHIKEPPRVRQWTTRNSHRHFFLEAKWTMFSQNCMMKPQEDICALVSHRWSREHFCWLPTRTGVEKWCRQCDTYAARKRCTLGPFRKDSHRCSGAPPAEWPRPSITADRHVLLYQVVRYPQLSVLRGNNSSGTAGNHVLPLLGYHRS